MIGILRAHPSDPLHFDPPKEAAYLHLDLDLSDLEDPFLFQSARLACQTYRDARPPILYKGKLPKDPQPLLAYMRQLAPCFPDELPLYLLFDASDLSFYEAHASLTQVEFFEVAIASPPKGVYFPIWEGEKILPAKKKPSLGLLFSESLCHSSGAEFPPFCMLYEDRLNEQWDGIDQILIDPLTVSPNGKRMLKGFAASGGVIANFSTT
jgi:hypothetical protein